MSASTEHDRSATPFDALLRELLTFNLVEPVEDGSVRGWRLTEAAGHRLAQLAAPPPPEDKVVYFSRRCSRCGEHRPTRLRSGGFVCDDCWREAPAPAYGTPDLTGLSA